MKKWKVGLVGVGAIARSSHLPVYKAHPDQFELVAVADINLERAQEAAKEYGFQYAFSSVEELLANADVDYIDICTWTIGHAPIAIAAAKAGKAILCEKPMADCLAHALEMEKAVKENGVLFMMAMVCRYANDTMLLHEMQEAGELGEVYYAKTSRIARRGTPVGWFTDLDRAGGGPILDIGVHAIDRAWFLMGRPKPVRVSANTYRKIGNFQTKGVNRYRAIEPVIQKFDIEDSGAALIHFENGASLMVEASWAINAPDLDSTQICGTKAGAKLGPLTIFGENELGYLTDNQPTVQKNSIFESEILHFADCLETGKTPCSSLEDGISVERMLQGIYDSAKLGREVEI